MVGRRGAIVLIVLAVVLVALPLLGRWERTRWLRSQNEGIAAVKQAVGGEFDHAYAYRHGFTFACLLYQTAEERFGRELCFNSSGYIVEAIHRFPNRDPEVWTVRPEPAGAKVKVNPYLVARLLDKLGAQRAPAILTGIPDLGPQ